MSLPLPTCSRSSQPSSLSVRAGPASLPPRADQPPGIPQSSPSKDASAGRHTRSKMAQFYPPLPTSAHFRPLLPRTAGVRRLMTGRRTQSLLGDSRSSASRPVITAAQPAHTRQHHVNTNGYLHLPTSASSSPKSRTEFPPSTHVRLEAEAIGSALPSTLL